MVQFYIQRHFEWLLIFRDGCLSRYPTSKKIFVPPGEITTAVLNTSAAGSGHNEQCVYVAKREDITFP